MLCVQLRRSRRGKLFFSDVRRIIFFEAEAHVECSKAAHGLAKERRRNKMKVAGNGSKNIENAVSFFPVYQGKRGKDGKKEAKKTYFFVLLS